MAGVLLIIAATALLVAFGAEYVHHGKAMYDLGRTAERLELLQSLNTAHQNGTPFDQWLRDLLRERWP